MTSPPQVFQITNINSGTQMAVTPAAGPALAAGTKYSILLSDNLSVDGLAQDIAETFTMYQRNISGFADVMNGSGDVTITVDGKPVTVPGQKSLAKKGANSDITSLTGLKTALSVAQGGTGKTTEEEARKALSAAKSGKNSDITELAGLTTALSIAQGGTGATDAAGIRKNAGLGTAAELTATTSNIDVSVDRAMKVGDFGVGRINIVSPTAMSYTGFIKWPVVADEPRNYMSGIQFQYTPGNGNEGWQFARVAGVGVSGQFHPAWRHKYTSGFTVWYDFYSTANTTKASDGSIKAASPVARIASPDIYTRKDISEASFEWCGYGVANSEARGIEITRDGIGIYRVTGAKSLASSGWRLLPPRDPDGSGDLGVVTAEQRKDEIIITLFRRKMMLVDGEIVIQPGEPIDVPANSWIDVRLDMPEPVISPEQSQTE